MKRTTLSQCSPAPCASVTTLVSEDQPESKSRTRSGKDRPWTWKMSEWSPIRSEYRSLLVIDIEAYSARDRNQAVGKPRILRQAIDALSLGLRRHNRLAVAVERLRIRVVVHAADLLIDSDGPLGDQVNLAFRLLDARELGTLLERADGPMLLCVSDILYRQVIFQRHEGLDPADFESIWIESEGIRELGWVCAPGESGLVAGSGSPPA